MSILRVSIFLVAASSIALADEVTDWNKIMLNAFLVPPITPAPQATRLSAIVEASVFDAVNGIERRFTPIHVPPGAAAGASKRAAAIQAAYASLVRLFPNQTVTFDQQRALSLANLSSDPAAIELGIEWGQTVADAIWVWRSTDGFSNVQPPFLGGQAPGEWRPTPPAFSQGTLPQLAQVTPWAIEAPSQFRPAGPPSLTSAQYAAEFNEVKTVGGLSSATRTEAQTLYARFWASGSPTNLWNPVATSLSADRHLTFSENARLLALLNISMADAAIGCWDAKYTYDFWRPVTAIQLATTDGNPDTSQDPTWIPLITTPNHPEYTSAHSCLSAAAAAILSNYFGDNTPFSVISPGMPGTARSFSSFSASLEEVKNARIYGGIHFRTACDDGTKLGNAVGNYILSHALLAMEFVTSVSPTAPLRTSSGWVGMHIAIDDAPLKIKALGRYCVAGNSQVHTVKLVSANTKNDVPNATASVNMAGCTPSQFVFADLSATVTLTPQAHYYLVSQEVNGGDRWLDLGPVTTNRGASVVGSIYFNNVLWITSGAKGTAYVPTSMKYEIQDTPPSSAFVLSYNLDNRTQRNNFNGFAGAQLRIGAAPLTVTSVGRGCITGNSQTHLVKFVNASTGADVPGGSATVNMANCGTDFVYQALGSPIVLQANVTYYLVSSETAGGDQWTDQSQLTVSSDATVLTSIYSLGSGYAINEANAAYVPPNFLYTK